MDPATKSCHNKYVNELLGLSRVLDKNGFRVNRFSVSNENMQHNIGACKYIACNSLADDMALWQKIKATNALLYLSMSVRLLSIE